MDAECPGEGECWADGRVHHNGLYLQPKEILGGAKEASWVLVQCLPDPRPELKRFLKEAVVCRLDLGKKGLSFIRELTLKAPHTLSH